MSKWAAGWEKKGWRKAGGEIKNLEIIQDAYALYVHLESSVQLTHVSAHVGTEGNELADRMAMFAVQSGCEELRLYGEELDVAAILRMQRGVMLETFRAALGSLSHDWSTQAAESQASGRPCTCAIAIRWSKPSRLVICLAVALPPFGRDAQ